MSYLQEQERSRQYHKQLEDIKSQINKSGNKSAVCVDLICQDRADLSYLMFILLYSFLVNIFLHKSNIIIWLQIKLLEKIVQKEIKSQPNGLIQKVS